MISIGCCPSGGSTFHYIMAPLAFNEKINYIRDAVEKLNIILVDRNEPPVYFCVFRQTQQFRLYVQSAPVSCELVCLCSGQYHVVFDFILSLTFNKRPKHVGP
ncbi:hypothetical protein [Microvirus mar58]|uniref:Uncharacterized protein n=1 Tax=Microvirus mar58 TaxID=2851194 RepID=A0A8F5MLT1_9VIRU|nr:hypothetical protein [Microvirus mar58]